MASPCSIDDFIEAERRQARAQLQRGGNRSAGIDDLVAANEGWQRQVEQLVLGLHHEAAALLIGVEVLAPGEQRRADAVCLATDHLVRFLLLLRDHDGHAGTQNAGLLECDLCQRRSELLGVVERDRRDDRQLRPVDHVGRVEPAAEANLEQQHIGRILGEREKGRSRCDLELRDVVGTVRCLGADQHVDQLILGDGVRLATRIGQLDALMEAHQVRRGVDVHARARRLQHRLEIGGDGSLAVGAGDVHARRKPLVRVAELRQQPLDASERQIDQLGMQQFQLGEELSARRHFGSSYRPSRF